MAEAEDVITDAAMHVASRLQAVRARRRGAAAQGAPGLTDVAARLDLLLHAAFGQAFRLRPSQPPLPHTMLERLFRRGQAARVRHAVPATDDHDIWLPSSLASLSDERAIERYRVLALLQATRARRGAATAARAEMPALARALFRVLEAWASERALARHLPGTGPALASLRADMLAERPDSAHRHPGVAWVEQAVRRALAGAAPVESVAGAAIPDCAQLLELARRAAQDAAPATRDCPGELLTPDLWLGELVAPVPFPAGRRLPGQAPAQAPAQSPPRSARLAHRPRERTARDGEDEQSSPGAFVVQTAQPHEKAEDPLGMQRPVDRDDDSPADEFADALSELPEARLVRTPGTPAEVLLGNDPIEGSPAQPGSATRAAGAARFEYPEWDGGRLDYLFPGTTVHVSPAPEAAHGLVADMHGKHAVLLEQVQRRFELLRARRQRQRRQLDGDEIDLDAWVDAQGARLAGGLPDMRVMQSTRLARRDLAVLVLVDISGSTDGWISGAARVIDVEREALFLVSHALEALGEPFAIQAFSGEGAHGVRLLSVKEFGARLDGPALRRIAALEPEHYTRTGSAIRHASSCLATQPARHRLLLLLTDGKPNDADHYEGAYGLQDMRRAVLEARDAGVAPFCLTVDRQAAHYLPDVFGRHQFAILPRTELLPAALLTWLRRLIA